MSGTNGLGALGPSNYGLLGQLITDNQQVQNRLTQLTTQSASGYISNDFGGLGSGAAPALDLTAETSANTNLISGIQASNGALGVTQTAMQQIGSIASSFLSQLDGPGASNVSLLSANAQAAMTQLGQLLDTQNGNSYVFAGQDAANPPVPNPSNLPTSGLATQIQTAVAGLATNGVATTMTTIQSIANSNAPGTTPFSANLSAAGVVPSSTTVIGANETVPTGILATTNLSGPSTAPYTTGSATRDLLASLATIAALPSTTANTTAYNGLLSAVRGLLQGVVTTNSNDQGILGIQQNQIQAAGSLLTDTNTALQTQLTSLENVNMAATISNLNQAQTQLQASYRLIANTSSLSLASYI